MKGNSRAGYRLKLAQGFLNEARQDVNLGLFDEADANQALKMAEEAVALTQAIIQEITLRTDEDRGELQD